MGKAWNKINVNVLKDILHRYFSNGSPTLKIFQVGDKVSKTRTISLAAVEEFSRLSGDNNVIHSNTGNRRVVVHGAFLNAIVSGLIGTEMPGHGTIVLNQVLNYPNKCFCGETVTTTIEMLQSRKIIEVGYKCVVESEDKIVLYGSAKLIMNKK